MDRTASLPRPAALTGALFMIMAGIAYAGVNVATQWITQVNGVSSTAVAFYQYLFALIFFAPWLVKHGRSAMATGQIGLHLVRALLSAAGVQAFIAALAVLPVAQVIALTMTSPFFVVAGAGLFLGEKLTVTRIAATTVAFAGAVLILEPWSASFTPAAFLPIIAAVAWATVSLMTKHLTRTERAETVTVYLLVLLTPINALWFGIAGFSLPDIGNLGLLLGLGALAAASQYFLARAYAVADAAYLQPFDDLKLPLNTLLGWVVFAYAPGGLFWVGALLIVGASLYIATRENGRKAALATAD